jgi:hypothetical protein
MIVADEKEEDDDEDDDEEEEEDEPVEAASITTPVLLIGSPGEVPVIETGVTSKTRVLPASSAVVV